MKKLANIPSICSRPVELGCVQYHSSSLGPDPKEACSGPQNTKPHSQYETPKNQALVRTQTYILHWTDSQTVIYAKFQIPYNNPPLLKVGGLTKIG